jgi:hypothetical protein
MRRRTPQEKKALSYAKDRRNRYGENDKSSRRSIRTNKAMRTRAHRHNVNQILQGESLGVGVEESELLELKVRGRRRREWYKYPDTPLGEIVPELLESRVHRHRAKMRRREIFEAWRARRAAARGEAEKSNKDA